MRSNERSIVELVEVCTGPAFENPIETECDGNGDVEGPNLASISMQGDEDVQSTSDDTKQNEDEDSALPSSEIRPIDANRTSSDTQVVSADEGGFVESQVLDAAESIEVHLAQTQVPIAVKSPLNQRQTAMDLNM